MALENYYQLGGKEDKDCSRYAAVKADN